MEREKREREKNDCAYSLKTGKTLTRPLKREILRERKVQAYYDRVTIVLRLTRCIIALVRELNLGAKSPSEIPKKLQFERNTGNRKQNAEKLQENQEECRMIV